VQQEKNPKFPFFLFGEESLELILLTTSRRPTGAIRTLCRDLANSLPNVVRVNRGKMSLDGIGEKAIEFEADRAVVVDRWRGGPGRITLFQLAQAGLKAVPPILLIAGVRLRRELTEKTRRIRSSAVTVEPEDSSKLERFADCLSQFFSLPVMSMEGVAEKHRASMHLSFGSSRRPQITFVLLRGMVEIGPRITLSKLVWDVS
jgi:rRNA maturation protein Rpf1